MHPNLLDESTIGAVGEDGARAAHSRRPRREAAPLDLREGNSATEPFTAGLVPADPWSVLLDRIDAALVDGNGFRVPLVAAALMAALDHVHAESAGVVGRCGDPLDDVMARCDVIVGTDYFGPVAMRAVAAMTSALDDLDAEQLAFDLLAAGLDPYPALHPPVGAHPRVGVDGSRVESRSDAVGALDASGTARTLERRGVDR